MQEGGLLPQHKSKLASITQKLPVQGETLADKARDFIGKGCLGGEQEDKETQENCSAHSLRFYGNGVKLQVVSSQSLACLIFSLTGVLPGGAGICQPRWIPA